LFIDPFAWKDLQPAQRYLAIGPCFHYIGAITENDVEMVRHDGVGEYIDPKDGGEFLDSLPNPFFSVGKIFSSYLVGSTKVSPTDTSLDNVEDRNFLWCKDFGS
jgi:hypothetical protein